MKLQIYATPTDHFTVQVRDIFTQTQITNYSGHELRRWLASRNMGYWPQQLNFALWCASTGCGISLLFEDKRKDGTDLTDSELHQRYGLAVQYRKRRSGSILLSPQVHG